MIAQRARGDPFRRLRVTPDRLVALFATLLLLVFVARGAPAAETAYTPPSEVQTYSFSIARGDPATASGLHPADILGVGGYQLIPCANLGLVCEDAAGIGDDIAALSYGSDFSPTGLPSAQLSVGGASQGSAGSAVSSESACTPAQAQGDAFATSLNGSNEQDLDGDGAACAGNAGVGIGLSEATAGDNLDALERDPCGVVDLNCDGMPDEPIFLTLAQGSPSLTTIGAGPADVLVTSPDYGVVIWASSTELGLSSSDAIDALCLNENGNGFFDPGDQLLFSLSAGSPSLVLFKASAADLLKAGPLVVTDAALLGLVASDELDGAVCNAEYTSFAVPPLLNRIHLPVIQKN